MILQDRLSPREVAVQTTVMRKHGSKECDIVLLLTVYGQMRDLF